MNRRKLLKSAWVCSSPVLVGYVLIGFGFGILLRNAGYGLLWALAMSLFIYAGSLQFVGVSLITGPATLAATALTSLMINARHLFYSISMIGRYRDAGHAKNYLIFALTDETYALLSGDLPCPEEQKNSFCLLVSLFNHSYWILGTALGSLFASALPFDTSGVEFSMTALFLASFTEQMGKPENRFSGAVGLTVTLVSLLIFGRDLFLIPAMAVILLLLLIRGRKEEG